MILKIEKTFLKDIESINIDIKNKIFVLSKRIEVEKNSLDFFTSYDIKKLSGYLDYYRIRFGDFRLVFKLSKDTIVFLRIKHRKDIYKSF